MKCPKYVKNIILRRANCAAEFLDLDCQLVSWLEKHNALSAVEDYDILTGCESICNPYDSAKRVIEAIEKWEEN